MIQIFYSFGRENSNSLCSNFCAKNEIFGKYLRKFYHLEAISLVSKLGGVETLHAASIHEDACFRPLEADYC